MSRYSLPIQPGRRAVASAEDPRKASLYVSSPAPPVQRHSMSHPPDHHFLHGHIRQLETEKENLRSHFGRELQALEASVSRAEHSLAVEQRAAAVASSTLATELRACDARLDAAEHASQASRLWTAEKAEWSERLDGALREQSAA